MEPATDSAVSSMPDEIAMPRTNGELLFEAPWEARAFGVAVALHEKGVFEWRVFSEALTTEIATAEQAGEASSYYERWVRALRQVTTEGELLRGEEIMGKEEEVREVAEHDHDHEDHQHGH
jgi:nitrile hydratase accessory protein